MGTNFYVIDNYTLEEFHFGKSSGGWAFAIQIFPEEEINNLDDWIEFIGNDCTIEDEYGTIWTVEEILIMLKERSALPREESNPVPYHSWEEFLQKNRCVFGYNNLLFSIDGENDEKYPTVQYFQREFS